LSKRDKPARTLEEREHQMINLAVDLAEKKLRDGTASSQIITHYLALGSSKTRLEKERLENENDLLVTKKKVLEANEDREQSYARVLEAMKIYSGVSDDEDI